VPGELNSKSEYSLSDIASIFPLSNVVKVTNYLTKLVMKLPGSGNISPAMADLNDDRDTPLIPIANAPEAIFKNSLLLCIIDLILMQVT
jgi:hypothetical protein